MIHDCISSFSWKAVFGSTFWRQFITRKIETQSQVRHRTYDKHVDSPVLQGLCSSWKLPENHSKARRCEMVSWSKLWLGLAWTDRSKRNLRTGIMFCSRVCVCREVMEYNDVTVPLALSDVEILEGKVHPPAVNDSTGASTPSPTHSHTHTIYTIHNALRDNG